MKWIDLSTVGCALYIKKNDSTNNINPETGLGDFHIKITDMNFYKDSLISESGLEDFGYKLVEDTNGTVFQRTSKENLKPTEFMEAFGADKIRPRSVYETSIDEIQHDGFLINLEDVGITYKLYKTKSNQQWLSVNFLNAHEHIGRVQTQKMFDRLKMLGEISAEKNSTQFWIPNPEDVTKTLDPNYEKMNDINVFDSNNSIVIKEPNNNYAIQEYEIIIPNISESIEQISSYIEKYFIENDTFGDNIKLASYKNKSNMSYQIIGDDIEAFNQEIIKKKNGETSLANLLNMPKEDVLSAYENVKKTSVLFQKPEYLKSFDKKYFKLKTGSDFNHFREVANNSEESKDLILKLSKSMTNPAQLRMKGLNDFDFAHNTNDTKSLIYNEQNTYLMFDSIESLSKFYGMSEELLEGNIEEVALDNDDYSLLSVVEEGVALISDTVNDPIIENTYHKKEPSNYLQVLALIDAKKTVTKNIERLLNTGLSLSDSNAETINDILLEVKELHSQFLDINSAIFSDISDFRNKNFEDYKTLSIEQYSNKNNGFRMGQFILTSIDQLIEKQNTYLKQEEAERIEQEKEKIRAQNELNAQETLKNINTFKEKASKEESGKKKILDYGEKIGNAVKDRWGKSKLKEMDYDAFLENLVESDSQEISIISKKSLLIKPKDMKELFEANVSPQQVYLSRNLLRGVPSSAQDAKIPPKIYSYLVMSLDKILTEEISDDSFRDYEERVQKRFNNEIIFPKETDVSSVYGEGWHIDPEFYEFSSKFNTTKEMFDIFLDKDRVLEIQGFIKNGTLESESLTEKEQLASNFLKKYSINEIYKQMNIMIKDALSYKTFRNLRFGLDWNTSNLVYNNTTRYVDEWVKLYPPKKRVEKESQEELDNGIRTSENFDAIPESESENKEISLEERFKKEQKAAKKALFPVKHLGHVVRYGEDYGVNSIDEETFAKIFRFRALEFGEKMPQKERAEVLRQAFNAFMDFSKATGIPPKDLSFDGNLAIAFGSRGKSSALAHFEPSRNVINLTRMKGAGSLAHEMIHAFDFNLTRKFCEKYTGFNGLIKGSDFISQAIIEEKKVKRGRPKDVLINKEIISNLFDTVTDPDDKELLKSYIDMYELMYKTKNNAEIALSRKATKQVYERNYLAVSSYNVGASLKNSFSRIFDEARSAIKLFDEASSDNIEQIKDYENIFSKANKTGTIEEKSKMLENEIYEFRKNFHNRREIHFGEYLHFKLHEENSSHEVAVKNLIEIAKKYNNEDFFKLELEDKMEQVDKFEKECMVVIEQVMSDIIEKSVASFKDFIDIEKYPILKGMLEYARQQDEQFDGKQVILDDDLTIKAKNIDEEIFNFLIKSAKSSQEIKNGDSWGKSTSLDYSFSLLSSVVGDLSAGLIRNSNISKQNTSEEKDLSTIPYVHGYDDTKVDSDFYLNAKKLNFSESDSSFEMLARGGESAILDFLKELEHRSDYLVSNGKSPENFNSLLYRANLYTAGNERKKINEQFSEMFYRYNFVLEKERKLVDEEDDNQESKMAM